MRLEELGLLTLVIIDKDAIKLQKVAKNAIIVLTINRRDAKIVKQFVIQFCQKNNQIVILFLLTR